jgi:hypothetical protein
MELEELHLSECLLIDGSFLETISQHTQSLQKLSIESIRDDTNELEFTVQGCMPNLHSFSLIADFPLSEQFIDSFISAVPNLKSLKLGEGSDVSLMLALREKCTLEEIDIDVSFEDVDKSRFIQALQAKNNLRVLKIRDHSPVPLLTFNDWKLLHFPKLREFKYDVQIKQEWLSVFRDACPNLEVIQVNGRLELDALYWPNLRRISGFGPCTRLHVAQEHRNEASEKESFIRDWLHECIEN